MRARLIDHLINDGGGQSVFPKAIGCLGASHAKIKAAPAVKVSRSHVCGLAEAAYALAPPKAPFYQ